MYKHILIDLDDTLWDFKANSRIAMTEIFSEYELNEELFDEDQKVTYRDILKNCDIYATGTTGRLIEEVANLSVHKYLAGHLGGEQQLCAQIEHNQIDLVIFLRDPLTAQPHEPDVSALLRLCDGQNIPLATNVHSAEIMLEHIGK